MSFPGQFLENGGREPTSPAIPEEDPRRGGRVAPIKGRNPQDLGEPSPSRRGGGQRCHTNHI